MRSKPNAYALLAMNRARRAKGQCEFRAIDTFEVKYFDKEVEGLEPETWVRLRFGKKKAGEVTIEFFETNFREVSDDDEVNNS